jgi:general secretion pathway protein K
VDERRRQRGVALLIALVTITLVTISVMQFTHTRQVDFRRTTHWLQAKQAALYADFAVEVAKTVLMVDRATGATDGLGEQWADFCRPQRPDQCPSPYSPCAQAIPADLADLSDLDRLEEFDAYRAIALRIEDVTGLYNINRLRRRHTIEQERDVARELFLLSNVDPDLIGPIVDWTDADQSPYSYGPGAEEPQYSDLQPPYAPRNQSLQTTRELALIKGMTAVSLVRLARNVVALPEDAVRAININTAPLEVLRSLRALTPAMGDETMLAQLLAERCAVPFANAQDLVARVPAFPSQVATDNWISYGSDYFRVLATGQVDEVYQSVEALLNRTESGIRVVYYLARRGAIIPGVDMSVRTDPDDLDFISAKQIGAF